MGKVAAFWSIAHGQPRTSSNMVALAAATALGGGRKCLLMQTHFNLNNLESYLIGTREHSNDVFMDVGIDGLTRSLKLAPLDRETIENYSIPLMCGNISLLPGTTSENKTMFKEDMGKTVSKIINEAVKYYDLVFIDVNSGADEISQLVLESADLVIVNLCQNKNILDTYFKDWLIKDKKVMYLIGSYDQNSIYNIYNLKKSYRPLGKSIVVEIPYNTGFMDAQSDGNVLKYLNRNLARYSAGGRPNNSTRKCWKMASAFKNWRTVDDDAYFMECVKRASEGVLRLIGDNKGGTWNGG